MNMIKIQYNQQKFITQPCLFQVIQVEVNALLDLKKRYQEANNGVPFDPPKVTESDKKAVAAAASTASAPEKEREGPSKKELNKLARKEKAANWKATNPAGAAV
jgi:hypothetical protein